MKRVDSIIQASKGYELIDCGNGRKLEQFGELLLDRPDPQALWQKTDKSLWVRADGQFLWKESGERWKMQQGIADSWHMAYADMVFSLSTKGFKHVGIFPEHIAQWEEIYTLGKKYADTKQPLRMLNLFGYTGAASVAGSLAGMQVTHVDASKTTILTVRENMELSGLKQDAMRIICEDAFLYVKRLVKRGEQFDVIVMDPPAFGRGPKGEVWKIEESLTELLTLLPSIVAPSAKLVILNGYAAGYSARTFGELLGESLKDVSVGGQGKKGEIIYGDIGIQQKNTDRVLTTGIYAKWVK